MRISSKSRCLVAIGALLAGGVIGTSPAMAATPARPQALPFGFTDSAVASVPSPTAVRALPNGAVAVLSKSGAVRIIRNGTLLATPALSLTVCTESERGLLGIAVDPGFSSNGFVYLYTTRNVGGQCGNRVSRFTMTGDVIDPASELVLIDRIPSPSGNHNGGDVEVGKDGFLYVSVGDGGSDPRGNSGSAGANDAARDMALVNGKILRLDRTTGDPAPGNPFTGAGAVNCGDLLPALAPTNTVCQEIFASGLRNPWRFAFDPNAAETRFFINDVGQGTREEIDLGAAGADYGWNTREGRCPQGQNPPCAGPPAGLTDPITDYGHELGSFITGGAFVPNGYWPTQYDGAYVFGDGGTGFVWVRSATGSVDWANPLVTAPVLTDMAFVVESTGLSLYYVTSAGTTNSVRKISFPSQTVRAPLPSSRYVPVAPSSRVFDSRTAAFGATPLVGNTPRTIDTGVDGPSTSAVLVNITYVEPAASGFLTAWAAGAAIPATSNINALAGEVVANTAVVPVDAQGRIQVLTNTAAHVVVDVFGRFEWSPTAVSAGRFVPLTPARLADTREPASAANPFTRSGAAPIDRITVPVRGRSGVPATGVQSVVLTVTAIAGEIDLGGYVTAAPSGATQPPTSNINTNRAGDIRPNLVVVPLGADGSIDLHLFRTDHVVVDVTGWFTDATVAPSTEGRFRAVSPYREADTRTPFGFSSFAATDTRVLDPVSVPAGAIGVSHNVTIVGNGGPGFVTAFPSGGVPLASTANATGPDQLRAAAAFTRMGADGAVRYYAMMPTQLVVDVTGWFEGPSS